ncbi:threonine aldolase family protein [Aestuariibius sp. 2305UL40-4]|uniref:threonine aldolase family protein n=1 Tax=Aestuariibius violaceus TaxID=3234132 RepID=UPI00345E3D7D
MHFASDNTGPVHPKVMEALVKANEGYAMPYGADPGMVRVTQTLRDIFEAPEAAVYLVPLGTAANSLILACLSQPWETIFCHKTSHIQEDECNAPEFYTGGTKLTLIDGAAGKMDPGALRSAIAAEEGRGVHGPQRGPISITQATEKGAVHSLDEIRAITDIARSFGLKTHMDGARFANALVHLGCSPAEMTWKAGIDAVSFGGTKNGLMGVEAVVFFDPSHAWEFELRRKRGAQLISKHRYLSAQMEAYLTGDLWLDLARRANAAAKRLSEGLSAVPDIRLHHEVQANLFFADLPRRLHRRLHEAGVEYYLWEGDLDGPDPDEPLTARFVADWSAAESDTDALLALLAPETV